MKKMKLKDYYDSVEESIIEGVEFPTYAVTLNFEITHEISSQLESDEMHMFINDFRDLVGNHFYSEETKDSIKLSSKIKKCEA